MTDLGGFRSTTASERAAFTRDGHVCIRGLFTPEEIAAHRPAIVAAAERGRHETRELADRDVYGRAFLQCTNLWRLDDRVAQFVRSARAARVAAELLGADGVHLYHDQALLKEPGGGHTPWHQDQFYWPFPPGPPNTVTAWIPLHDLDPAVGSMTFASGTHLRGDLSGQPISDASESTLAALVDEQDLPTTTHGALAAGDATFHAGWTLHRAGPNPTSSMREVMTMIYVAAGTRISEPTSAFEEFDLAVWLPGQAPGDVVGGPRNPRCWPA